MTAFLTQDNRYNWRVEGDPFPMVRRREVRLPLPVCLILIALVTGMAYAMATVLMDTFYPSPLMYGLPVLVLLFMLPMLRWTQNSHGSIITLTQDRVTLRHFPAPGADWEASIDEYLGVLKKVRNQEGRYRCKIVLIHKHERAKNVKLYKARKQQSENEIWQYYCDVWHLPGLEQDEQLNLVVARPC